MRSQGRAISETLRDTFDESPPSSARPIDLVHLARQTLGDRSLELEVLNLMVRQIRQCADRIELATERERGSIAHALKGAALNIGAFPLAERAKRVEEHPGDERATFSLVSEMKRTTTFIGTLLGWPPTTV